ncbi:uncharacterized protein Dana_GF17348, isoform A [Drosophila ananassae]|uniref:Uncharacterized protein, isoform A n=1 Tax=Drosophila ananassae TaxID=7217 RepID=B3LXT7_DROAN|nr:uncharacterized protein LOC6500133 [Drosophila ananassae]XP_032312294.1 uncharacterized protein LOC6500133 [Drosophila ananassae]EDV41744.1 uncharacterized protein Dana_GF17348, isoform A [Drosophila ananassae]
MKSKKSAFANTSTGYGRHKHSGKGHSHGQGHSSNKDKAETKTKQRDQKDQNEQKEEDKDLNSGFGDYLRTPEAFEMMKLFVFANTIMLIVTMAWPHIKEQFYMINQWLESFREAQQQ